MKRIALVCLALSMTGCASYFKRKSCEAINWFEHGQKVALSGKRLNADDTVMECRKVEADIKESQLDQGFKSGMQKYCSNEQAYQTGKEGDFFSRELCDGPQINVLLSQHKKGVADYCAKSNGQQAGASGKKYQNICPKNLEPAFLTEYRKGRKRYVTAMIANRQEEVREIENKINGNRVQLAQAQGRLFALEREKNSLESQKSFTNAADTATLSYLNNRLESLNSDISSARHSVSGEESQIRSLEQTKNAKQTEISNYRAELPSLEE